MACLIGALDQLLGYLTWRDSEASLIIFNSKNKNFSKILEALPDTGVFQFSHETRISPFGGALGSASASRQLRLSVASLDEELGGHASRAQGVLAGGDRAQPDSRRAPISGAQLVLDST